MNNKHNVPKEAIRMKLKKFQLIIPYYFGWFLNEKDSAFLKNKASAILDESFEKFSILKEDFNLIKSKL